MKISTNVGKGIYSIRNEQNCDYMMMLTVTESNLKVLTMFMFELLTYGLAYEQ